MIKRSIALLGMTAALTASVDAFAAIVFSDNFSVSTLNSLTPTAPTTNSTAYHLFSSKSWSPAPTIAANDLKFGIGATTSGHIEVQAVFAATPVSLVTVGDYLELTVTFTNTTGLFTTNGHVGFGVYNSGGNPPIAGGMQSTAVNTTSNLVGGALGWKGYVGRIAFNGGSHRIATRPAQSSDFGNNMDLITEGKIGRASCRERV